MAFRSVCKSICSQDKKPNRLSSVFFSQRTHSPTACTNTSDKSCSHGGSDRLGEDDCNSNNKKFSNNDAFNIYYHNCSGIRTKSRKIYNSLLCNDYDLVLLSETWLSSNFKNEEFFPKDYQVYRQDRYGSDEGQNVVGGGLVTAVKHGLTSSYVCATRTPAEMLCAKVKCAKSWLYIVNVYIACGSQEATYSNVVNFVNSEVMSKMGVDDSIMIIGDFNLPKVEWSSIDGVLYQTSSDVSAIDFLDGMNALGLSQFNSIRNNNGRTLDLVFCSCSDLNVVDCEDLADCQSMHHQPLNITYYFVRDGIPDTDDIIVYNYRAGDYPGINEEFSNINWMSVLTEASVDDCVLQFNSVLKHSISRFIPQRVSKSSFKEPWFNKRLINLQNRKSKASKRYSKSKSERDQQIYKDIRKEFKTLNDFLYQNYMTEIEMEISSNPKRFFAYINSRKNSRALPSVISHNGTHFEGIQNICNTFAEFFKNNYLSSSSNHIRAESVGSSFTAFSLTLDEVKKGLDNLDISKGPGPDGIPTIFLKKCSTSLTRPLTMTQRLHGMIDSSTNLVNFAHYVTCISNLRIFSIVCHGKDVIFMQVFFFFSS